MLPPELRVGLAGLAVFRLAALISQDDGPLALIRRFRTRLGLRAAAEHGKGLAWTIGELVHCPYCLGVYLALIFYFLVMFPTWPGDLWIGWWGLSGAQALLEGVAGRSR